MSIEIPDSVTYLGYRIFYGCKKLTNVILSKNLVSIPDGAFEYCSSLEEITIPDGVLLIGSRAFYDCLSLLTVTLPLELLTVKESCFSRSEGYIETVNYKGTKEDWALISIASEWHGLNSALNINFEYGKSLGYGDVNSDGSIGTADPVLMAQYIAGWAVSIDESVADVNCDSKKTLEILYF